MRGTQLGLVALAGTMVTAGLAIAACNWVGPPNTASDDSALSTTINEVRLDNPTGDVTVLAGTGPVTVHRVLHYHDNKPGQTTSVSASALVLSGCGDNCSVDYSLRVPAGTTVNGSVFAGDITVTGVATASVQASSGELRLTDIPGSVQATTTSGGIAVTNAGGSVAATTTSGSVHVNGVGGDLSARTQSGSVVATGLRGGHTLARVGSGDVAVTTDTSQDVDAQSTNGSVELTVPAGAYHVLTSVVTGTVEPGLADDPNGTHTLRAVTTNGEVRVRDK